MFELAGAYLGARTGCGRRSPHNLDPSTCGQSVLLPPLLIPVIEGIVQGHLTLACINQLYMYLPFD